jgi:hypothetical protein
MESLEALLEACIAAGERELHRKAVLLVLNAPRLYSTIELSKLFTKLDLPKSGISGEWGFKELLVHVQNGLQEELKTTRAKDDWSINEKVGHDCADCKHLEKFLTSTTQQTLSWPLAKQRRKHIHQIISAMQIPVAHTTRHDKDPQQLILTKAQTLFSKEEKRVREAKQGLLAVQDFSQRLKS